VSIEDELVALDVAPVRAQPAGVGLYVANLARELTKAAPAAVGLIGVRADSRALAGLAGRVLDLPLGDVDRVLVPGTREATYRDAPASVLVPRAVPALRLVTRAR